MNSLVLSILILLIHLTNDISHLIKLSFNTPKPTRGLDALSVLSGTVGSIATQLKSPSASIGFLNSAKVSCLDKGCAGSC
jgi:hypothetical protein